MDTAQAVVPEFGAGSQLMAREGKLSQETKIMAGETKDIPKHHI